MYDSLLQQRFIPVVEIDSAEDAPRFAEALLEGEIPIVEVTMRTAAAAASIAAIGERFPEMMVGAGTVLTEEDSAKVRDAGARFGVAPGLNPRIVESFHAAGLPFLPGVITPTEIEQAFGLDCRLLKFYPAEAAGGVSYLRALSGPYASRGIRFCATGGITPDNLADYLACPIVSAVGGGWVASRVRIAANDWSGITADCRRVVDQIQRLAEST